MTAMGMDMDGNPLALADANEFGVDFGDLAMSSDFEAAQAQLT